MSLTTIAVDKNNDIYLDADGNLAISYDLQAVLQGCEQAAKTLLGEMVLNVDQGIPYFDVVWVGVPNIEQYNAALRTAFFSVPDVLEVVSLMIQQTNNTLAYTAIIRTSYGSGGING